MMLQVVFNKRKFVNKNGMGQEEFLILIFDLRSVKTTF